MRDSIGRVDRVVVGELIMESSLNDLIVCFNILSRFNSQPT